MGRRGRDGGERFLTLESVDIAEVAREAAIVLQPATREKGLDLSVDAPDRGPELRTDAGKLRQILVNLVSNAVKYTEEGMVRITVRLPARSPDPAPRPMAESGA